MEEKKMLDNQSNDDNEKDFNYFGDGFENLNDKLVKQYGRDFMLQLRLHPLSLQKPKDLPNVDFVKEKLYLNHISGSNCTSEEKHGEISYFHTPLKPDYCNMKHDYQLFAHYYSRMYPHCFSPHMYNGNYQNSLKFRPPFHTYCAALKKSSLGSHSCYRDYHPVDECLLTKRYYSTSDDLWSCYPGHSHSTPFKKQDIEAVPKTKKKLSIIDPATGKNILDGVTKSQHESELSLNNESVESSGNFNEEASRDKYGANYCSHSDENNGNTNTSNEYYDGKFTNSGSEEKLYFDLNAAYQPNVLHDDTPGDTSDNATAASGDTEIAKDKNVFKEKEATEMSVDPETSFNVNAEKRQKYIQGSHDNIDAQKLLNRHLPRKLPNNKAGNISDVHSHCQNQYRKEFNAHVYKESLLKQNDCVSESVKQLREKVYSLRQEQQKMAILQSFLRYKKYQLEENARSLDEKKIEMANWEYSLLNKAKLLQEKEHWLENKCEILSSKAQQLAEKERLLNKEKKVSSETQSSRSNPAHVPKESQFSEKKYTYENPSDILWEKLCNKVKNYKNDETVNNEYFGYCSNQNKSAHNSPPSNVEKCKADANTLDELEKNIVMMEKIHTEAEECSLNNKTGDASSHSSHEKDENEDTEPIGYSKGRRYLPEPLKYWLNNRDKKGLN